MLRIALAAAVAIYLSASLASCRSDTDHDHAGHDHGKGQAGAAPAASAALPIGNTHAGYCQVQGDELDIAAASSDPKLHLDFEGKRYLFCCEDCKPLFDANPKKYITHPPEPMKSAPGR